MMSRDWNEVFSSDKLEPLMQEFESYLMATDRGRSVRAYVGDVSRFIKWSISKYDSFTINATSPLDLVEYRTYMQQNGGHKGYGAAPATVNRALISLKIFFSWLKREGQIKDNPSEDIKMVAIANTPVPRWLTRSQQARLIRAVRQYGGTRDEAIIGLMLHAGLRVSELCNAKRGDLYITAKGGKICITGKGNKYREVPLNSTIRKILSGLLNKYPTGPLFPNKHGKGISTRGVFKMVTGYAYIAKIEGATPHTLRHTFCKNAIDMGISIDQVAAMAGHSSLDVTKRYTAPSQDDLQKAVEKLSWE